MRPTLLALALVLATGPAMAFNVDVAMPTIHFPTQGDIVSQDCVDLGSTAGTACDVTE